MYLNNIFIDLAINSNDFIKTLNEYKRNNKESDLIDVMMKDIKENIQ